MGDGEFFDRMAATYDRARPAYPERTYEVLEEHGVLAPGVRLLEVGAGSGQATGQLIERGGEVTAVEPALRSRPGFGRASRRSK